jgi:uncharacterized membrane protein YgcG
MSELYDILEICLQDLEKGASLDSVFLRFPERAGELRPILETAMKAIRVHVPDPSSEVVQRNRAKVLQHAAEMREAKVQPARRLWSVPLRRALVTLVVIVALFMSSTGLVRAASTTLPGDQLYPVKRTWEDVHVLFTFNVQARDALEVEHENERLNELRNLFAAGRSAQVDFSGLVTRQNADLWLVAGIPVAVSAQTTLPAAPVIVGNAIHVIGTTQKDGAVLAQRIELLPSGVPLPKVNDDNPSEIEQEGPGSSNQSGEDHSGKGSGSGTPTIESTKTPKPDDESESESSNKSNPKDKSLSGVVQSINGDIVVINGQIMNINSAEISGTPQVGASAKVEGHYDANGLFIVTKIEYKNGGSSSGSGSGSDNGGSKDDGGSGSGGGDDDHGGSGGGEGGTPEPDGGGD